MIDRGELLRKLALNLARFSGLGSLAGRYVESAGAILMMHRVTNQAPKPLGFNRHLAITPAFLDAVLSEMKTLGFLFVTMDEAADRLTSRACKQRFATFTLDDGYRDNLTDALPVFEKHGAPFTIYVAPALIEGTVELWWDVLEDIVTKRDRIYLATARGRMAIECSTPGEKFRANTTIHNYLTSDVAEEDQRDIVRELARSAGIDYAAPGRETLMNWDEIRTIAAHPLATIGAHTLNHYNLMRLPEERALREMSDGARFLDVELGVVPRHFAFPYGYETAVGPREVALARQAGFRTAVTTRHGILKPGHAHHLHALPRISINGRYQQVSHLRTMVGGLTTPLANGGRRLVTV
ncbi:MAG: polysaccharide deacetylase family protein [Mesorhizobium sp.]|nr:polysaccharide deacetylase family protein [Mesorhizobium sp.]